VLEAPQLSCNYVVLIIIYKFRFCSYFYKKISQCTCMQWDSGATESLLFLGGGAVMSEESELCELMCLGGGRVGAVEGGRGGAAAEGRGAWRRIMVRVAAPSQSVVVAVVAELLALLDESGRLRPDTK